MLQRSQESHQGQIVSPMLAVGGGSTESKDGLLFKTWSGTPHLHNNIEDRWLTKRLKAMKLDEPGMGWHAFRRFRETRVRGDRCQADINVFWMGHEPETMSELYSHLFEEVESDWRKRRG